MGSEVKIVKYATFRVSKGVFDAYIWDEPMSDSYRVVIPVPDAEVERHKTIEAQADQAPVKEESDGE